MDRRTQHHRDEVVGAYRAADRLRFYAVLSALIGVVVIIAVIGAMLIGWLDESEGLTWLGLALLVALVPAARFRSDAIRTTVNAATLERQLGLDEDLYAPTATYKRRLRIASIVGAVVALVAVVGIAVYSVDNADTREPTRPKVEKDDDDKDDDDEKGDDDDEKGGGSDGDGGESGDD